MDYAAATWVNLLIIKTGVLGNRYYFFHLAAKNKKGKAGLADFGGGRRTRCLRNHQDGA
jgi:hypothetical protein